MTFQKKILTALFLSIFPLSISACTKIDDNKDSSNYANKFEFALNRDGESYFITKYIGKDRIVTIPNKIDGYPVSAIGLKAFKDNEYIEKVILPSSIKEIEYEAFYNAINLTDIDFQGTTSIEKIGRSAFHHTNLTKIVIPNSVTSIGEGAFAEARNLESITLPFLGQSRTTTGSDALLGYLFGTSSYSEGYNAHNYYLPNTLKEIIINEATSIGDYAFSGASSLTSIVIPNDVTSIGSYAFYGASGLTKLVIQNGVTSIGREAFGGVSSLTTVLIPIGVTSIGSSAFSNISNLTIYAEAGSKPSNWDSLWNNFYGGGEIAQKFIPTYWSGQWHYVNGNPTPYF